MSKCQRLFFAAVRYAALATLLCLGLAPAAQTQGGVAWSESQRLSDPSVWAWVPTVAADAAGNVHVMWSQTMTQNPPAAEGDTLFYARWDGRQWSTPHDVLVTPGGAGAEFPDLAVTPDGMLHAVWGTGGVTGRLMYAHAPACCADMPANWSKPVSLGGPVNLTPALVADSQGRLHAAFAALDTRNIVYLRSDDGGNSWPIWVEIEGGMQQGDEYPAYPRLAVDGRGRVHAVWTVMPWQGRLAMYARSDDGGTTWGVPQVIDSADRADYVADYGPIFIDVETHGEDEIHFIWDGAPTVERNHAWSSDGGATWSAPVRLIPEITQVGRAGWNDMVADSAGTLHAVALIRPWYAQWTSAGGWSRSTAIGQTQFAEWIRLALSRGNQLHVVWTDKTPNQPNSVWYVHGQTSAPAAPAQALPTVAPSPAPGPTSTVLPASEDANAAGGRSTPTAPVQSAPDMPISDRPINAILISVLPALIVVGAVIAARVRQMRTTGGKR